MQTANLSLLAALGTLKPIAKGCLTWIPGLQRTFYDRTAGGGTADAVYCYGVWLKHLALLHAHGMAKIPRRILELGPGASLGTGIASLLSGAERYVAIDTVAHVRPETNLAVLRELIGLFRSRAPRPRKGWPDYDRYLDGALFPSSILTEPRLREALAGERLQAIAAAVAAASSPSPTESLRYRTWSDPESHVESGVDLVFSHAVLCLVDDLDRVYGHFARVLKPGGWMSHQMSFDSHEVTREWNGHWRYGERLWKLVRGRRPFFVNREPASTHLEMMRRHGFEIVATLRRRAQDGLPRNALAPRWREMPEEDLSSSAAFFIARKRA